MNFTNETTQPQAMSDVLDKHSEYKPAEEEFLVSASENDRQNYLFVSFDLCNSTELKSSSLYWFDIIETFLKANNLLTTMKCWKFNGDEILYYTEVNTIFEIIEVLQDVHKCITDIQGSLLKTVMAAAKERFLSNIKIEKSLIGIRSAIWIAQTNNIDFKNDDILNYRFELNQNIDFSGINIDEGFRLRVLASKQKLIVDPKIVAILHIANEYFSSKTQNTSIPKNEIGQFLVKAKNFNDHEKIKCLEESVEKFRILGYQTFKGIWNGHEYPVILYSEDWKKIEDKFQYDEKFGDKYIIDILSLPKKDIPPKYQLKYLLTVLFQVNEVPTVASIMDKLDLDVIRGASSTSTKTLNSASNLYYMVVCVNKSSKSALIFKRSDIRKHLKGVWDFGNVKHVSSNAMSMNKKIESQFKTMFDLDIKVFTDDNRECSPIHPYALCTVHRYGKMHNGILCVAEIKGDKKDDEILVQVKEAIEKNKLEYPQTYRYTDVMFVNEASFETDDFKELSIEEIKDDSKNAELCKSQKFPDKPHTCINNCRDSIIKAISEVCVDEG